MKKLNKKGFTLIELLAVIVVLAIIMVIATQQVNKTISRARANSFIESYQMIVKQVKTFIASDEDPKCSADCLTKYELSTKDYSSLSVSGSNGTYTIKLESSIGKFKNLNLSKYGDAVPTSTSGASWSCDISGPEGNSTCTSNSISGTVSY